VVNFKGRIGVGSVPFQEIVVRVLLKLNHVLMNHIRSLGRKESNGTHDNYDAVIRPPLCFERLYESLVLFVQVSTGFLEDAELDVVAIAVRNLRIHKPLINSTDSQCHNIQNGRMRSYVP